MISSNAFNTDRGELYTWGWPLHIESVLHLGAQFDRFPAFVQGMQQRAWASYLPERINFRRAQTTPLLQPQLAGKRFRTIAVGASFYIAVDGPSLDRQPLLPTFFTLTQPISQRIHHGH
jgi:hypothetical protein